MLAYLISQGKEIRQIPCNSLRVSDTGGDVNVTDGDGDTPLYTVENVETAKYLVDRGAVINRCNNQGISVRFIPIMQDSSMFTPVQPIEYLTEDFAEVANYLQTASGTSSSSGVPTQRQPSQYQQDAASESLTASLMESVGDVMQRAQTEGRDPDEELRRVVGQTVLEGVLAGYEMTEVPNAQDPSTDSPSSAKRSRTD
jgi:hypothetical protein